MTEIREIGIGLLGAGRIGRIHARNLAQLPGVRMEIACDPRTLSGPPGFAGFTRDENDVFKNERVEAVLICSPSPEHARQIEAAAAAGKHIFCEKPVALDPEVIRHAISATGRAGVLLQTGFNRRFDPNFMRLRKAVLDGGIGDVHIIRITSRDPGPPPPEYIRASGGLFCDMTIHDFDMVRHLSGSEVAEVYASGTAFDPEIAALGDLDTATVVLRLKSGALALIENSRRAVYGYDQRVEVFGSKGCMRAENETPTRTFLADRDTVRSDRPLDFFLERYAASYRTEMEAFIVALRTGEEPRPGGEEGLRSVLLALAAARSLETNTRVPLP